MLPLPQPQSLHRLCPDCNYRKYCPSPFASIALHLDCASVYRSAVQYYHGIMLVLKMLGFYRTSTGFSPQLLDQYGPCPTFSNVGRQATSAHQFVLLVASVQPVMALTIFGQFGQGDSAALSGACSSCSPFATGLGPGIGRFEMVMLEQYCDVCLPEFAQSICLGAQCLGNKRGSWSPYRKRLLFPILRWHWICRGLSSSARFRPSALHLCALHAVCALPCQPNALANGALSQNVSTLQACKLRIVRASPCFIHAI